MPNVTCDDLNYEYTDLVIDEFEMLWKRANPGVNPQQFYMILRQLWQQARENAYKHAYERETKYKQIP